MPTRPWRSPTDFAISILGGRVSHQKELGFPFQLRVIEGLARLGAENETTDRVESAYPDLPRFPPPERPRNAFGADDLVIGFGIYLATKLGEAAVSGIATDVYEGVVRPAFSDLWTRIRRADRPLNAATATFDHWFDASGVLVRVVVHLRPKDEPDPDLSTDVPLALASAAHWLTTHPVTHRVLTYHVRNRVVDAEPTLTEPIT